MSKKTNKLFQQKKSKAVVFFLLLLSISYVYIQLTTTLLPINKAQSAFAPLAVTVTIPPSLTIDPKTAKVTLEAVLSQTPQSVFDFPGKYPDYYSFAKNNLFNNQDFWTLQNGVVCTDVPNLVVYKSGPATAKVGDSVNYTIDVHYTGTGSVTVTDTIPAGIAQLVGIPSGKNTVANNVVSWKLLDQLGKGPDYQFTLTLKILQDNVIVANSVCGKADSSGNPQPSPVISPVSSTTPPPTTPCAGGDGSGCICDTPFGVATNNIPFSGNNNGYQTPYAGSTKYCANDEYCDPRKAGKGLTGAPCTKFNTCTCDSNLFGGGKSTINFTCNTSGGTTYKGTCQNNTTCKDSNPPPNGFPCK